MSGAHELHLDLDGGTEREAGDRLHGAVRLQGPKPERRPTVTLRLERRVLRGERAVSQEEVVESVELRLEDDQPVAFGPLELPMGAFTFEGQRVRCRWTLTAELTLAGQREPLIRALSLTVRPAPGRGEANAATLAAWRGRLAADRAGELRSLLGYGALSALFFVVAAAVTLVPLLQGRGVVVLVLVLALGAVAFGAVLAWLQVWPRMQTLQRRAQAPALPESAVACGAELRVPAQGSARPCWALEIVERSHHVRKRTHGRNDYRERVDTEHRTVVAEGQGAATPLIPEAGPPTAHFGDARVDWELRFFTEGRPEDATTADVLVLPWRVGG